MESSTPKIEIESLLQHSEWLERLAQNLVRDAHAADDLVQKTWEAAIKHPPRSGANPRSWLGSVLRNQLFQNHRSEKRRSVRESRVEKTNPSLRSVDAVAKAEMGRLLVTCILRLAEPFRTTILLRYQADLSPKQVGRKMGVPATTVRSRTKRGLEKLRAELPHEVGLDWIQGFGVFVPTMVLRRSWPNAVKAKAGMATLGLGILAAAGALFIIPHETDFSSETDKANAPHLSRNAMQPEQTSFTASIERTALPKQSKAALTSQEDGYFIDGQCLSAENQQPIAGCDVEVFANDNDFRKKIQTGADGYFHFNIEGVVPGGEFSLSISKPDRIMRRARWSAVKEYENTLNLGAVSMERGATISGLLLDEAQQPIAGAYITFSNFHGYGILDPTQESYSGATTSSDGSFILNAGVPEGLRPYEIRAKGFLLAEGTTLAVTSSTGKQVLNPVMIPVPSIRGYLRDTQGSPINRAYLVAQTGQGKMASDRTDESGYFQIYPRYLDTPPVTLKVEAKGHTTFTTEVIAWGQDPIELIARTASSLAIRVIDAETKEPVEEYSVICFADDGVEERSSKTNSPRHAGQHSDGNLQILDLQAIDNILTVIPSDQSFQHREPKKVNPTEHVGQVLEIEVQRMKAAQIQVRDQHGNPVASSLVTLCDKLPQAPGYAVLGMRSTQQGWNSGADWMPYSFSDAKTDGNGMVTLYYPKDLQSLFLFIKGNHEPLAAPFLPHSDPGHISTYRIQTKTVVSGKLLCREELRGKLALEFSLRDPEQMRFSFGGIENLAIPDSDGQFQTELEQGTYDIGLLVPDASQAGGPWGSGWTKIPGKLTTVEVAEEGMSDLLLDFSSFAPVRISGVATLDGEPIVGGRIRICLWEEGKEEYVVRAQELPDANGRFDLKFLPPGKYEIRYQGVYQGDRWEWPISAGEPFQVLQGEHHVGEFQFSTPRSTYVQVLNPNTGKPITDLTLVMKSGTRNIQIEPDAKGWAKITPAPTTPFTLLVFINQVKHLVGPITPDLHAEEDRQTFPAVPTEN